MKTRLVVAILVCIVSCPIAHGQNMGTKKMVTSTAQDSKIINMEEDIWKAFQNKTPDVVIRSLADDYTGVYSDGMTTKSDEVNGMKEENIKSFSFSEIEVSHPENDIAILTYKVKFQGDYKGKDISGTSYAASVYLRLKGEWQLTLHTEAKSMK